jgi:predicted nucleic acid-binding protein
MVKVLLDTSVLVAAALPEHPQHSAALAKLLEVYNQEIEGFLSNHTLSETDSVLTRFPRSPKLTPIDVAQILQRHLTHFTGITLETEDYRQAITRLVNLNLPGGVIFDALIAEAALKVAVDQICTLNPKDFRRLGEPITSLVETFTE